MLNPCIISTFKLPLVGGVCSLCDGQNLGKHKPQNLCSLRGGYGAFIPAFDKAVQQQTNPPTLHRAPSILASREKENGTLERCRFARTNRDSLRALRAGTSWSKSIFQRLQP